MLTKFNLDSHRFKVNQSAEGEAVDIGLVAASIVVGMFLPVISAFAVPSGVVNLLWGSIYGSGFAVLQWTIGLQRGGVHGLLYGAVGFVLWPAIVAYALGRALRALRQGGRTSLQWACRILSVLSLLVVIPISNVQDSLFEYLPLFTKYIDF